MSGVTIRIPGDPVAKGRPRATAIGGQACMYTPATTRAYEQRVAIAAREAMAKAPTMDGPLSVSIEITMPIPVSWSKRKQADALAGLVMPTGRPDLDNLIKALADACNWIVWRDDAQIVRLMAEKRYGEQPGAVVSVIPLTWQS